MNTEEQEQLEKDAEAFANEYPAESVELVYYGYIAGANSQLDQLKRRDETIKELKHTLREILGIADLDPLYLSKGAKKYLDNAEKLIK